MSHKKKNIISSWHTVSFSIYSYPKGFSSGWTGPSNFKKLSWFTGSHLFCRL